MSAWTARLTQLGITLPGPAGTAGGTVPAVRSGGFVHTSVHLPLVDGVLPVSGAVGAAIGVPEAADLARTAALNALAAVDAAAGIDAVAHVVKVVAYVAAGAGFADQGTVLDGATELLGQVFGAAGAPAGAAIGVTGLPLGAPVGVELLVALHDRPTPAPAGGRDRPDPTTSAGRRAPGGGEPVTGAGPDRPGSGAGRAGAGRAGAGRPGGERRAAGAGPAARIGRAFDLLHTGRWDEADELLDPTEDLAAHPFLAVRRRYGRALLTAARGDTPGTWRLTDGMVGSGVLPAELYGAHARALAALGRGDFAEAYRHAAAVTAPGQLPADRPQVLSVALDLAEAAARAGRPAEAAAHADALHRAGVATRSPRLALLTAGAAALAAPPGRAPELFRAALAVPQADRWPFDLARIRLCYGERLRRDGRARQARTELGSALAVLDQLGATPWAARAAAELRATAATRSRDGAAQLTPQEREIAELAARGLTNKEIGERLYLSPRTVGSHLHHVFPKLGIGTRAALRDALGTPVPGPR